MMQLPISVMIVGYNEVKLLPQCLQSINFCDEILYTDLGSTDASVAIAQQYNATIFYRDKRSTPSCEMAQAEMIHHTKHDWVIFIDPDEVVDESLALLIQQQFSVITSASNVGAIMVPWHFYFKQHKLKGTVWGGNNKKFLLVNKQRFHFKPIVHYGRNVAEGFDITEIDLNKSGTNILHHYWMNSYRVFIKKHQRYLKNEGIDEYNRGRRVNVTQILLRPWVAFKECFITYKGYKDGFIGFSLSIFWAYYKTNVAIAIRKVQRQQKK